MHCLSLDVIQRLHRAKGRSSSTKTLDATYLVVDGSKDWKTPRVACERLRGICPVVGNIEHTYGVGSDLFFAGQLRRGVVIAMLFHTEPLLFSQEKQHVR